MGNIIENIKNLFVNFTWDNPVLNGAIRFVILLIAIIVLNKILLFIFKKLFYYSGKRNVDLQARKRADTLYKVVRSSIKYASIIVFVILALPIFGLDPTTVFASAGLIGIVVTFAFQDLLKDIVAGFFVIFERTYEVGDYVKINTFEGTVTAIGLKTTVIVSASGERNVINNRDISTVVNYTQAEYALVSTYLNLAYETDFERLYAELDVEFDRLQAKYPSILEKSIVKGVNEVKSSTVEVLIHTKVKPLAQYQMRRDLNLELFKFCREHGFEMPYDIITIDK